MDRIQTIIKVSRQGIIVNVFLSVIKAIAGILANSIAVILDAVNNLSDAISQVITIIGTKLSSKKPDKDHPYGHGRIEYITSVILSVILIITGLLSIKESFEKIINPTIAEYTSISFIVIVIGIIVKFIFGRYVKKIGKNINSGSLIAIGTDSYLDSVITFSTLIAALISKFFSISLEGILGVLLSLIIVKSGMQILIETMHNIIGIRVDGDLSKKIKDKINSYKEVEGAYDLILHDYGPINTIGSVHIEIPYNMNAEDIHKLTRKISTDIYKEFGILLTIGIYATNFEDNEYLKMKNTINEILKKYPEVLQMHAFYIDTNAKTITFDLVINYDTKEPFSIRNEIIEELKSIYKEYKFDIIIDNDFSD